MYLGERELFKDYVNLNDKFLQFSFATQLFGQSIGLPMTKQKSSTDQLVDQQKVISQQ